MLAGRGSPMRALRVLFVATVLGSAASAQSPAPPPPVALGTAADARWTPTTIEAASAPANKDWLKRGKTQTVAGEIVDVSCYMQLGKRGPKHIDCGAKCVRAGQPGGIVDDKGNLWMLMPEQHHPRRDAQVSLATWIAAHMGARATITGVATTEKGQRALFVQAPPVDHAGDATGPAPVSDATHAPASPVTSAPISAPTTSPLPSATPSPRPELMPGVAPSPSSSKP